MANIKGGVGKTTSAVYLALGLSLTGRTLLVDADAGQESAMRWSELADGWPHDRITVVPWGDPKTLTRRIASVQDDYAHVVVDTRPKDHDVMTAAMLATGNLLVPTTSSAIDVAELAPTFHAAAQVDTLRPVLASVLLTKVRLGTRSAEEVREVLTEVYDYPLMHSVVPLRETIAQAYGSVPGTLGPYADVLNEILTTHTEANSNGN
ncbi:AAA family ATPase [Rhodococcus sp. NPDC056960]|uniref:AAA family ATPase n=1 Tax=Rhodococcus sp. NPDC056960 TaxID=3345982 RepID=UPI00363DAB7A